MAGIWYSKIHFERNVPISSVYACKTCLSRANILIKARRTALFRRKCEQRVGIIRGKSDAISVWNSGCGLERFLSFLIRVYSSVLILLAFVVIAMPETYGIC